MQNKSIIYIISGIGTGGAEQMLGKILTEFNATKLLNTKAIIVLTRNDFELSIFNSLGIDIFYFNFRNILLLPFNLVKLILLIKKLNPDIVQTWMYHADLFGGICSRIAGVKNVIWGIRNSFISSNYMSKTTQFVVKVCVRLSYFIPKYILCNSIQSMKDHENAGYDCNKFKFIPNGFDINNFNGTSSFNLRNHLNLDDNSILIGNVGRYHLQKNQIGFLKCAKLLHEIRPDIHFVMAGTNVDYNNELITEYIQEFDLSNNVHLLGIRKDLELILPNFNFLLSSSLGEAFPNIIGESMLSKVICICTDVGDCREIIGPYGLITKDSSPESMKDAIMCALNFESEYLKSMGTNARNRIIANYNIEKICNDYLSFYLSSI